MTTPMSADMDMPAVARLGNEAQRIFNINPADPQMSSFVLAFGNVSNPVAELQTMITQQQAIIADLKNKVDLG